MDDRSQKKIFQTIQIIVLILIFLAHENKQRQYIEANEREKRTTAHKHDHSPRWQCDFVEQAVEYAIWLSVK